MTPRQARVALGTFVLLAAGVTGNALYLQGDIERPAPKSAGAPSPRAAAQNAPLPPVEPTEPRESKAKADKAPDRSAGAAPPPGQPGADRTKDDGAKDDGAKGDPVKTDQADGAQAVKVRVVRVATIDGASPEDTDPETVRTVQAELSRLGYGPLTADGIVSPATTAAIMAFEHEHRLALTGEPTQKLLKQLLFGVPVPPAGAAGPPEVRSPKAQAMVRQVQQMLAERGYRPGPIDGRLSPETISAIRTFEADQGLVPKGRISVVLLERLESGMAGGGRHRTP